MPACKIPERNSTDCGVIRGCGQILWPPSVFIVVQPFRAARAGREARTTMAMEATKSGHTLIRQNRDKSLRRRDTLKTIDLSPHEGSR